MAARKRKNKGSPHDDMMARTKQIFATVKELMVPLYEDKDPEPEGRRRQRTNERFLHPHMVDCVDRLVEDVNPEADLATRLACLLHDCDRAFPDETVRLNYNPSSIEDYDAQYRQYKAEHSRRSATIARAILGDKIELSDLRSATQSVIRAIRGIRELNVSDDILRKVEYIILWHDEKDRDNIEDSLLNVSEPQRDEYRTALQEMQEADSISFFRVHSIRYLQKYLVRARGETRKKGYNKEYGPHRYDSKRRFMLEKCGDRVREMILENYPLAGEEWCEHILDTPEDRDQLYSQQIRVLDKYCRERHGEE